ncbi:MAG: hypothetical protein GTO54_08965, partial [Nitrososphaeria archaeon]|nr:hypothetical protein [Nitrososphaeria archaeon]
MANEDMMVKRFKELGIKASAARAYMALVKIGPCSATRISQSSGVPQPRTYDVMNYLQEKGFVEVQKVGRRNVYKASKPDFALDRLMNEMRSKETYLRSSLRELENIGEASSPKIWVIKGRSNITAKAREIIDQSDIELLLAVSPDFLKRSMLASLRKAARRGVSISVILNASSDISPDELGELAELGTIRQRRVYRTTIVMGDYERALLLFHKKGNFEEEKYGLYTEDDGLLHIMDCHFCNFLWVPSEIVVKREAKERSFTH